MASTYVNDLRLNEMATGDESGNWGVVTNTNLELIGEALGYGTEGITTNADTHTTTIADGAADPGRAMYLEYTGTLDSACTITIAPNTVSRMHFIENGTSGSQNIIISQGSGANITIPPGDTKAVYLDGAGSGAAVVDAFASLNVVDLKVQDDLTVTDDVIIGGDIDLEGAIDVNGTANLDIVDIDGAVDMASTLQVDGVATFTGRDIHSGGITIANAGQIGSVGDTDAIAIASDGVVTLTQKLVGTELDISGNVDIDGTTNLDNTDIDGTLDVSGQATFADGSAGAPSISNTGDVNAGLFFSAADVMSFSAGGTAQFTMADGSISPVTDNDIDLGTASLKYKSFFAGLVDTENFKVNGGQGSDGQVLTSTGSGVAWEDASGGSSVTFKTFGTASLMVGSSSTGTINAADYNTAVSTTSFAALTTGDFNVAFGEQSLDALTTGGGNTALGVSTLGALSTANNNTAVGISALTSTTSGTLNTSVGSDAMSVNTTGSYNVAVGSLALDANTSASYNTSIGYGTLTSNTTGHDNTAVGINSLAANTTAHYNTAVGSSALEGCTTGEYNTAVGQLAMDAASMTGNFNSALGRAALGANTSGSSNCAVGINALGANTTGGNNCAMGDSALDANTTGSNSVAIGKNALGTATTADQNTACGNTALTVLTTGASNAAFGGNAGGAATTANGTTLIGDSAGYGVTTGGTNTFVGVAAGAYTVLTTTGTDNTMVGAYSHATAADAVNVNVFGRNVAGEQGYTTIGLDGSDIRAAHGTATWATVSDRRVKKDIEDSTAGLSFINDLRPRTFNYKNKGDLPKEFTGSYEEGSTEAYKNSKTQHGFIAQEVKEAIDNHSDITDGFKLWDVRDTGQQEVAEAALIPMLVKAIQELSAEVEKLKGE